MKVKDNWQGNKTLTTIAKGFDAEVFTGQIPNQQCQNTEGTRNKHTKVNRSRK